jgi:hypothetical protein
MNTAQIEEFLKTTRRFQGVFSSDRLPSEARLLVCNTDPHRRPGEHWICINVDVQGRGEYFDSFGQPPTETFKHYEKKNLYIGGACTLGLVQQTLYTKPCTTILVQQSLYYSVEVIAF